jgi:hypothetical protein
LTLLDEDKPAADELLAEILKPTAEELQEELLSGTIEPTKKRTRRRNWDEKQQVCYMVCANLIHARYARKPLMVPMDQNAWVGKPFVPKLIRRLIKHKLLGVKPGTEFAKRNTRIWANKKLLQRFRGNVDFVPEKWVTLKDAEGKWIDYEPTELSIRISKILEDNYLICKKYRIEMDGMRFPTALHAVFHIDKDDPSFSKWIYGRMHCSTAFNYQKFTEEERSTITFDGEKCVELDYSGLHPRILYAQEHRNYQKDPYLAVSDNEKLRPFLKILLLALVNTSSIEEARQVGNNERNKLVKEKEFGLFNLLGKKGQTPNELIEKFKRVHRPISKYFCTNFGMKLMRVDSKIAVEVISECNEQDIPVLCVYDSFIVPASKAAELREIMEKSYKLIVGNDFDCEIK